MSIKLVSKGRYSQGEHFTLDLGLYPDNTPVVNMEKAWNRAAGKFSSIVIQHHTIQNFFTGMMVVETIRQRGGSVDNLVLPYIPGARQDRQKWEGDWLETLRYVGKTINAMNFKSVLVADPHSPMAGMAIERMRPYDFSHIAYSSFVANNYDYVVAPDAGAAERAGKFAKRLKVPLILGAKHRDPATNQLSHFSVDETHPLMGKRVLLVDDICDAGGTFLGLETILRGHGASSDLFVTHGLFSKGTKNLRRAFGTVYSTDSLSHRADGVTVLPIVNGMIDQCA